ncbi:cytochrome-c peroxidase [Flavobacterium lindanitolerans]|jgi:cytochrome c peroxidase|uniref:cytochrome-c peroxidase n=1 Tax=Flavobacterium lindanitolerans TaxID=428988 RepID=UPI0023F2F9A4|nr:cytochrome c peroxidase [Flavobacterium lindanitolerans]
MKLKYFIFLLILFTFFFSSCQDRAFEKNIKQELLIDLTKLKNEIILLQEKIAADGSQKEVLEQFKKTRLQYKRIEWAVEYFVPETARFMNGPALDEMELEENKFFVPNGFQVIEEHIYPEYDFKNKKEIIRELDILLSNTKQVETTFGAITITDDYVLDALQQNVHRILTLGITGFDSPILNSSIPEARQSLSVIPELLLIIQPNSKILDDVKQIAAKAKEYCDSNPNFNTFNRAVFITEYLNPLSQKLNLFQKEEKIPAVERNRPLKATAATLFDENAFDVNGFVASNEYRYSDEKAILGEKLFYDKSLSKDGNRSCASCHNSEKAFTDGLKTNVSLKGKNLNRNTPTLTYASFQNAQFWDMRQLDLEKQSVDVIQNEDEMHGSLAAIHSKVSSDREYIRLFQKAYPKSDKTEAWQIQNAISSYVRSLNSFDSRFDSYMRGNKNSINAEEIQGMNLFMGKAKCATCHFTPLFNGTVPPNFAKTEHEVVGTPEDASGKRLSKDEGRYIFNQLPQLKGAFKTPTLRNVAVTAPYMHNGAYATLEEVVEFYDLGGGTGLGLSIENQTLPTDKLNLTAAEKKALVAFMKTLTDKRYN